MSTLAEKVAFARKHWSAPGGKPFEIDPDDPDDWLYQHYWRPLHSYRLMPVDLEHVCDECRVRAGSLVEDYFAVDATRTTEHAALGCAGLQPHVIRFVLLHLRRQSGKTVGTSGYVGATLYLDDEEQINFISGSEDQSDRLFETHYEKPIINSATLLKRAKIIGNTITVRVKDQETGIIRRSSFTYLPTSLSGATGDTTSLVVVDEARLVPGDVFMAMVPKIFAQNGWRCSIGGPGHTRTKGDLDTPKFTKCSTCGARLTPWSGKVLVMSSAGEIDGGDKEWFFELLESNAEDPHPSAYVYDDLEARTRHVAESTVSAVSSFFGKSDSLKTHVDIEVHNKPRRKGEEFISEAEMMSVIDKSLRNMDAPPLGPSGTPRPCVAFLDTSTTVELTSLVIVGEDSYDGEPDWHRLAVWRVDVLDPKHVGVIDESKVLPLLEWIIPAFSPLVFRVDTRVCAWAMRLVQHLKRPANPCRRIVDGVTWRDAERLDAWQRYEERIIGQTIRHPDNPTLRKELRAARRIERMDGKVEIREANRKRRHLDIAESVASACFLVLGLERKPKRAVWNPNKTSQGSSIRDMLNTKRPSVPRVSGRGRDWT